MKRSGCSAANPSRMSRARMSSGVRLAKRRRTSENCCQNLVAWRDSSTTCNDRDVCHKPWLAIHDAVASSLVDKLTDGSLDINSVPNLHAFQMLVHLATLWKAWVHTSEVHFHKQVHMSPHDQECCHLSLVCKHASQAYHDFLAFSVICMPVGSPKVIEGDGSLKRKIRVSWLTTIVSKS